MTRLPPVHRAWVTLLPALALALLVWPLSVRVFALSTHVQDCTASGDDQTCTFGAAPATTSAILTAIRTGTANTASITGYSTSITTLEGPTDAGTGSPFRLYLFCMPGDGSDTTFVSTTSDTTVARTASAEFANTTCTEDGTSVTVDHSSLTTHTVTMMTVTDNAVVFGFVGTTSSGNATYMHAGSTTSIPSNDVGINGASLGGWLITTSAGSQSLSWTTSGSETTFEGIAAVQTAVAASGPPVGSLSLLGVGK